MSIFARVQSTKLVGASDEPIASLFLSLNEKWNTITLVECEQIQRKHDAFVEMAYENLKRISGHVLQEGKVFSSQNEIVMMLAQARAPGNQ